MGAYITDLAVVTVVLVGLTALLGVITNGIGEKFFGGKKRTEFVDQSNRFHEGWKLVGGNKKYKTF
ncbi:hypothetical protein [Neobacillus sp. PS3-40]|jgi:hypothetical protein|uniref:hypothetical protein n=1 Tax=Neobacillus sp. PS3-40 TaxID=3070679 RepID=UPI0027E07F4C|nr:hypothetical protein [Neobacillus sp. PS3-40]WML43386.1 hypothetical protein RCG20_16520 [Neobacillus sp. PS3-40]